MLQMEDEVIIALFFDRSEQAIRELDKKYGRMFRSLSYRILSDRQDVEECVNDAYLCAWNAIPPERPACLEAYLCRIVRNLSLKVYRFKAAAKRSSVYTVALEEISSCIANPSTVEHESDARNLGRLLEQFLATLTHRERVIFMRRYAYLDTYAEIAKRVGISEKNVSVRLTLIRRKMKQYFTEKEVLP